MMCRVDSCRKPSHETRTLDATGPFCKYHSNRYRESGVLEEPDRHRYPIWPLFELLGYPTVETVAQLTGYSRRSINRWLAGEGMRWDHADKVACAAGFHPAEVWPEYSITAVSA